MKCRDIASKLPELLAASLQDQCRSLNTAADMEALLRDPFRLERQLMQMEPEEIVTLRTAVSFFGYSVFPESKLLRCHKHKFAGASLRLGLVGLLKKAVLFELSTRQGEVLYVLPEETFSFWQNRLFEPQKAFREQTLGDGSLQVQATISFPHAAGREMMNLLLIAAKEGLRLTNHGRGGFYKRITKLLADQRTVDEELVSQAPVLAAGESLVQGGMLPNIICLRNRPEFPPVTALMVELAQAWGLLTLSSKQDAFLLKEEEVVQLLHLNAEELQAKLFEQWRTLYNCGDDVGQHVIGLIFNMPAGVWVELPVFLYELERCMQEAVGFDPEQEVMKRWLLPMAAMGWLEIGEGNGTTFLRSALNPCLEPKFVEPAKLAEPAVEVGFEPFVEARSDSEIKFGRLSAFEIGGESEAHHASRLEAEPALFVQPDFEIVAPPDTPLLVKWQLSWIAENAESDWISHYKLSPHTVKKAVSQGWHAEQIIRLLKNNAKYGLPDHIEQSIREWAIQAAAADHKETDKRQSDKTGGDDGSEFSFPLTKLPGISKHFPQEQMREPDWQIVETFPGVDQLYPGLEQVPAIWLQEFRDYHDSTKREMAETALRYKGYLRLKLAQTGDECVMIVQRLFEHQGTWKAEGMIDGAQMQLDGKDWGEMQLILPGVHNKKEMESLRLSAFHGMIGR